MQHDTHYATIRRHVGRRIGLYIHATVFVVVCGGLWLVNLLATPATLWAPWPMSGWGIGLLFHTIGVVLHAPGGLKQRMIERELQRYRQRHP